MTGDRDNINNHRDMVTGDGVEAPAASWLPPRVGATGGWGSGDHVPQFLFMLQNVPPTLLLKCPPQMFSPEKNRR